MSLRQFEKRKKKKNPKVVELIKRIKGVKFLVSKLIIWNTLGEMSQMD